jgi:hypothetical protein
MKCQKPMNGWSRGFVCFDCPRGFVVCLSGISRPIGALLSVSADGLAWLLLHSCQSGREEDDIRRRQAVTSTTPQDVSVPGVNLKPGKAGIAREEYLTSKSTD